MRFTHPQHTVFFQFFKQFKIGNPIPVINLNLNQIQHPAIFNKNDFADSIQQFNAPLFTFIHNGRMVARILQQIK